MPTHSLSHTTIAGFPAMRIDGRADRPPLLFVHGAFVTHEPFGPWMEFLGQRGWRSVAASRRGRLGVGPKRAGGLGFADYLDDTRRVIDALGELPIIVGHSSGGLIAQKLAELGMCEGLVLLAPAPAKMLLPNRLRSRAISRCCRKSWPARRSCRFAAPARRSRSTALPVRSTNPFILGSCTSPVKPIER